MESRLIFNDDLDKKAYNMNKGFQNIRDQGEVNFPDIPDDAQLFVAIALLLYFSSKEDILKMIDRKIGEDNPELAKRMRRLLTKELTDEQTNQKEES